MAEARQQVAGSVDLPLAQDAAGRLMVSPTEMREALREELPKPIMFSLPSMTGWSGHSVSGATYRKKPYLFVDPSSIIYKDEDHFLVSDGFGHVVTEVDRNYNVIKEFGKFCVPGADLTHLNIPTFIDYNAELDRVLIPDLVNDRVLEVDWKTLTVVRSLTSTTAGVISRPRAVRYDPLNPDRILISEVDSHYVVIADWDGNEYWHFGVYGVSGSDATHLNEPWGVDFIQFVKGVYYVGICDRHNDRFLIVDNAGVIDSRTPIAQPANVRWYPNNIVTLTNLAFFDSVSVILGDHSWLISRLPFGTNNIDINWTLWKAITTYYLSIFEFSLAEPNFKLTPRSIRLWSSRSLGAGEEVSSSPIWMFGYDKVSLFLKNSQTADFYVEVYKTGTADIIWDYPKIEVADTKPLTAAELYTWATEYPLGIFRVRVVNGATPSTLDGWLNLG
jgi:hypothetical protein